MQNFNQYEPIQERVMQALDQAGEWLTVGQVAGLLNVRPNSTIRTILDTLAYTGWVYRQWGWTGRQTSYWYKINREVCNGRR